MSNPEKVPVPVQVHVPESAEKNPPQDQTAEIVDFFNKRATDMQPFLGFRLDKQDEFVSATTAQQLDGNHWTAKRAAYEQHFNQDIASPNWGKPENIFAAKVLQAMRTKNGKEIPAEETDLFGYEVLYQLRHYIGLSDGYLEKCTTDELQQKLVELAPVIDCAVDISSAEILLRTNQTIPENMDERRNVFRSAYTDVPVLRSDIAGNIVGSMMAESWTQQRERYIAQMQKVLETSVGNLNSHRATATTLRQEKGASQNELHVRDTTIANLERELEQARNQHSQSEAAVDNTAEVQALQQQLEQVNAQLRIAQEQSSQFKMGEQNAMADAEALRSQLILVLQKHGDDFQQINAELARIIQKLIEHREKGLSPQQLAEIIDAEYRFVDTQDSQKAPQDERAEKQKLLEKKEAELFAARDDYHSVIGRYETEEGVNVEIPYAQFVEAQKQAWIAWKVVNAELFSAVLPTNHDELYQSDQHYRELYDLMRPLVEGTYPEGDSFIYLVPRYIEGLRLLRRRPIEIDDDAFNNLYKKSIETIERYTEGKVADNVLEGLTVAQAEAQFGPITLNGILDKDKSIYDGSYITYVIAPGIYPSDSLKQEDSENGTQLVAAFEKQTASVEIDLINPGFQLNQNGGTEYQLQLEDKPEYGQTGSLPPPYTDTLHAIDAYKDKEKRKKRREEKRRRKK